MIYKKDKLNIDGFDVNFLAKKFSTPIYCYSLKRIKENILSFKSNFKKINPLICFAVKANSNVNILKEIKNLDLGADIVSIGELMKALKAGIKPHKIVFSGVGKTNPEIEYAVNKKILLINTESKSEILEIEKIAKQKKRVINIGIRLNPNIDPKLSVKFQLGKKKINLVFLIKYFFNL